MPGSIILSRARINFGKVAVGSTKPATFKIKNTGKGDLHVTVGSLDAPFHVVGEGSMTLAKGQSSPPITVQFAPTAGGPVTRTLVVTSDDPKHLSRSVTVIGNGK